MKINNPGPLGLRVFGGNSKVGKSMKILALDMGGTFVKSGSFQDGALTAFEEFPTQADRGAVYMVDKVCDHILAKGPEAVSISTTGVVDPADGKIVFATDAMPGFSGFPLMEYVARKTGLPVAVENDGNCAAVGEAVFGAARDLTDFLCVTYGTGIGGGVFLNGKLFTGYHGLTAEIGHIITHANGAVCSCGQRGCYEMYASTAALARRAAEKGLPQSGRELCARRREPVVAELLDAWCDEVVAGLVSLTRTYNPQAILLGGGVMAQAGLVEELRKRFSTQIIPVFYPTQLIPAALGNQAGIYGAYALARERFEKGKI